MTVRILAPVAAFCAFIGCGPQNTKAPHAQTPSGVAVSAVLEPGGSWTRVEPTPAGDYEILPHGLRSRGVRLSFYAPSPSELRVDIDGSRLPKFEDIPTASDPAETGYYRIEEVRSTGVWTVAIHPPRARIASTSYDINVRNVSLNPGFRDPNGNPEVSAPLTVRARARTPAD